MSDSINISLRYGSDKHTRILRALNDRKCLSEEKMQQLYPEFESAEKQYLAYLPETEADRIRKGKRDDEGVPAYTTIKIPYTYAVMLSAHTFWTSVFLARTPIMQYTGRHGETQMQTQAVEALVDYQVHVGRMLSTYYMWLHDAPKYGFGVLCTYWANETKQVSRITEEQRTFFGQPTGVKKKVKRTIRIPGYEGNRAFNVRPYDYLPDPRVPLMDPQKGEFCGRKVKLGWNALVRGAKEARYFNLETLQKMGQNKSEQRNDWGVEVGPEKPADEELPEGNNGDLDVLNIGMKEGYEMIVDLIPKDWKLGESDQPEKWVFTVVDELVVVEARPMGALHDEFPYDILPMEFDAYTLNYRSMFDTLKPLNDTLDWLINTHFFNVRSSLNNQFVVDPQRVVMKDVTRSGAGKLIRLKEAAYGTSIRDAIMQLPVGDVTQGHLRDTVLLTDLIQRVSGVTDSVMGMMQGGGRKTATEVRTSSSFGVNRLKTMAEFWSATAFQPHAQRIISSTQQYYDSEQQFKVAGDLMKNAERFMQVTPDMIAGSYDFVPVDGTLPIDRYAQANLWREILGGITKLPQIQQKYDIGGIFGWMAQLAGLKNISQFELQVVPDAQLINGAQQGNVVPMTPENVNSLANDAEPGQISGNGPTG